MIFLVIPIVFGFIGGFWARSKNLSLVFWGITCALLPDIGLGILAFHKPGIAKA